MKAVRKWNGIFEMGIKCQSKIFYPEKISFKYAGKITILGSTKAKRIHYLRYAKRSVKRTYTTKGKFCQIDMWAWKKECLELQMVNLCINTKGTSFLIFKFLKR